MDCSYEDVRYFDVRYDRAKVKTIDVWLVDAEGIPVAHLNHYETPEAPEAQGQRLADFIGLSFPLPPYVCTCFQDFDDWGEVTAHFPVEDDDDDDGLDFELAADPI